MSEGMEVLNQALEDQRTRLAACEEEMERGFDTAWDRLKEIYVHKLYKADFKTFKEYCETRWGLSKTRAHQLIDHSIIVDRLKSEGVKFLPTNESETRALTKLRRTSKGEDDFLQKASNAWEIAIDTAPKKFDVPQVTGKHVESTMAHFGIAGRKKASSIPKEVQDIARGVSSLAAKVNKLSADEFVEQVGADKVSRVKMADLHAWLSDVLELG